MMMNDSPRMHARQFIPSARVTLFFTFNHVWNAWSREIPSAYSSNRKKEKDEKTTAKKRNTKQEGAV